MARRELGCGTKGIRLRHNSEKRVSARNPPSPSSFLQQTQHAPPYRKRSNYLAVCCHNVWMAAQSGIGIKLSLLDSKLRIDGVMDRGPAFNAGIRAGWYGWFLRRAARPLRCSNRLFPNLFLLWSLPVLRYLISIDGLDVSDRAPSTLQPLLLGAAGCSPPSSSTAIF